MTVLSKFPFETEEIENLWIPMPDGVRLAARVFMPTDAGRNPVPAIIFPSGDADGDQSAPEWVSADTFTGTGGVTSADR